MTEVDFFIADFSGEQKQLLQHFHNLLSKECELEEKIRFKIPFYFGRSWVCYLNPNKDGSVELAFPRGNELSNYHGLLEDKDRKQVRSVTYFKREEIPVDALRETIQEAILLDETVAYKSKRSKKG